MRRRQLDDSSSDEYGQTGEESDYCSSSETDLTDVDDNDDDDVDEVNAADKVDDIKGFNDIEGVDDMEGVDDVEEGTDCAYLIADEFHPPEYYLKQIEEFNEFDFSTEDYSKGTTRLLDRIEEQWYQ
jgi:hypothetical protein